MIGAGYMATWPPWQVGAQLPHLLTARKLAKGLNGTAVLEGEVVVTVAKGKWDCPCVPSLQHQTAMQCIACRPAVSHMVSLVTLGSEQD